MNVTIVCGDCGTVLVQSADTCPDDLGNCEVCGSPKKSLSIEIVDTVEIREEFDATGMNPGGDIPAERISRTDGNTTAELAADQGRPAEILAVRPNRVAGFDEEGVVA